MHPIRDDLSSLLKKLIWYSHKKFASLAALFERIKNFWVDVLMYRRGVMQKRVWHTSMIGLASLGVVTSGVFGGQTLISSTYPGVGGPDPRFVDTFEPFPNGLVLEGLQDLHTDISDKPRSEVIEYQVKSGDTLSGVAQEHGVSAETIKWANNLSDVDQIKPGDTLKILPVTGVAVQVKSGDTLESVAKKYQADAQTIVDFPFNDIPDDFSLKAGQTLIIPDGQPPEAKAPPKPKYQPQYLAQGPGSPTFNAPGGSKFIWPTQGQLTQYYAWYHRGIDIANRAAPGVAAAEGGTVIAAGWDSSGYGNKVVVDHGNGYRSLYAHFSNIYVTIGQVISRGQIIGQMGSTGRSTGTHLHFEIYHKGVPFNPLSILK